ncbi:MAG: hypothetical protein WC512_05735 [Candidatus Omnitrophota bacterium]
MSSRGFPVLVLLAASLVLSCPSGSADVIELKDGVGKMDGKIVNESDTHVTVKLKAGGTSTFPKAWIKNVVRSDIREEDLYTKQDIYFLKVNGIKPDDASAQLQLAKWCYDNATPENGLFEMADRHYRIAKELDPKLAEKAGKDLAVVQEKEAEKLFAVAETEYKWGEYYKAEQLAKSVIFLYPDSSYAGRSRGLITKIWGNSRASKVLENSQELPEIVFAAEEMQSVLSHVGTDECKQAYFIKCINRGIDYEERAEEVDKDRKGGYYIAAVACYDIVAASSGGQVRKMADSKARDAIKRFFDTRPEPSGDARHALITGYMLRMQDRSYISDLSGRYFKQGEDLLKKAGRLKQPEKGEKAKTAYFCFSIANDFSKDVQIKQDSFENMVECQRLERARK